MKKSIKLIPSIMGLLISFNLPATVNNLPKPADGSDVFSISKEITKNSFYVGIAGGYNLFTLNNSASRVGGVVSYAMDPRLQAQGWAGGAFLGYAKYFSNYNNAYIGIEIFGNGSAADSDNKITTPGTRENDITNSDVDVVGTYGIGLLPGVKINQATLLYLRLGYNWATINVTEILRENRDPSVEFADTHTSHGANYGMGVETTFYDNFSLRMEYTYTKYSSLSTKLGNSITPANNQFIFGLIYHFL